MSVAWTGEGEETEEFVIGEFPVYHLNPYFQDGTRLRVGPDREAAFSGEAILNDVEVEIVDLSDDGFARVRSFDANGGVVADGWIRERNLTHVKRGMGLRGRRDDLMQQQPSAPRPVGLKRGATISNLMPSSPLDNEEETPDEPGAQVDGLFSTTGKRGLDEQELAERRLDAAAHVRRVRNQLRRRKRATLDPHSHFMQRWDSVTTAALLFTASVTPFEVCILPPTKWSQMLTSPLWWTNRVVDSVFVLDILMNFFLAYQEPPDRGGGWVYDNQKIVKHYCSSWMTLDVLTAIPVDVIIAYLEHGQEEGAGSNAGYLRLFRMLRLLKLARVLRASRIFRRWQAHFGISFAVLALFKFVALILITSHWLACAWVLIGRIRETEPDTADQPPSAGFFGNSWIIEAGLSDAKAFEIYGVAIFVAFSSITSASSGSISPASPLEYYLFTAANVFGSAVWAYVISSSCGIIATLNPSVLHYRHLMDELNYFARDKKLPRPMTVQLREFVTQTAAFHRQKQYEELLDKFSAQLKAQAALHWAHESLVRVPYFKKGTVEDEFLASAALALRPRVVCRTETIAVDSLTVIERGIAAREGRIFTKGSCLGTDMVLNTVTFRDLKPAVALTFVVQVACLDKKALELLLVSYPRARREVRSAAFKLAFTRAVLVLSKEVLRRRGLGVSTTILEAFAAIRKQKARASLEWRSGEPTRKVLASSLEDLAERTEAIASAGETSREQLTDKVRSLGEQMRALDSKFDVMLGALASRGKTHERRRRRAERGDEGSPSKATPGRVRGAGIAATPSASTSDTPGPGSPLGRSVNMANGNDRSLLEA